MEVNCEKPVEIINKGYDTLVLMNDEFVTKYGEIIKIPYEKRLYYSTMDKDEFIKKFLNRYEIICVNDKQQTPFKLIVPCGKCAICMEKKKREFCMRVRAESSLYDYPPIFATLTYAKAPEQGVNKRDVQLFLKRFRKAVDKEFNTHVRYFLAAEYGRKKEYTQRPHYHVIIWGLPVNNLTIGQNPQPYKNLEKTKEIIKKSWGLGRIDCQIARDYGGGYAAKYMYKYDSIPDWVIRGRNPEFTLRSLRPGIGHGFIEKIKEKVRHTPIITDYPCYTKLNGKLSHFHIKGYAKNCIFPRISQLIKHEYKLALYYVIDALLTKINTPLDTIFNWGYKNLNIKLSYKRQKTLEKYFDDAKKAWLIYNDKNVLELQKKRQINNIAWLKKIETIKFPPIDVQIAQIEREHREMIEREKML